MKAETVASIRMLAAADPETTPDVLDRIIQACSGKRAIKRDLIDGDTARALIGGDHPISKVTLCKWAKRGKITPVRISRRIVKYDRIEIENLAYNGQA